MFSLPHSYLKVPIHTPSVSPRDLREDHLNHYHKKSHHEQETVSDMATEEISQLHLKRGGRDVNPMPMTANVVTEYLESLFFFYHISLHLLQGRCRRDTLPFSLCYRTDFKIHLT